MRTARRLGYGVVAVYSDADRERLHVREADEAVRIGEALPAQSYLQIDAIIAAAKASGADAVHPGYGFLAENADFAQACRDAGLVFIGPSPEAIRAMGNKAGAKDIMQKAGVPCVPGYQGADQSDAVMLAEAKKIGFPVMIKAVAGGGGRGMRLVADAAAFPDALRSARSEAQGAFGDPTVILERAIVDPRHIEIQVFGDRYGNAIHLGERDCSVQRRHQKLIEEAPSPAVSPELRARMGAVAVAAVKAIGYEGAGTLEFLLDASGEFYFMEMNTRLQVEHPVTEAITGLDLVELQLRVASGEPLGLMQEEIKFSGHAIEVRLCSEDAGHDFMPQSGRMALWQMPDGIRVEHALQSGSEIPPFYDLMIAKLISHGETRDAARRQLIRGLEQTAAFGVTTNQAFLAACLRIPRLQRAKRPRRSSAGTATNCWRHARTPLPRPRWRRCCCTSPIPLRRLGARTDAGVDLSGAARVELGHSIHDARSRPRARWRLSRNLKNTMYRIEIHALDGDSIRFSSNGLMESAKFLRDGDRLFVLHRGITIAVRDLTLAAPVSAAAAGGDGKVRAAMNGRVVAVLVKPGEKVDGRPAGDDAGSDEDGACAHRRDCRHDCGDRCRGG